MRSTKRWRRKHRGRPDTLPSYLLPPPTTKVVFDPSLRRASEFSRPG